MIGRKKNGVLETSESDDESEGDPVAEVLEIDDEDKVSSVYSESDDVSSSNDSESSEEKDC